MEDASVDDSLSADVQNFVDPNYIEDVVENFGDEFEKFFLNNMFLESLGILPEKIENTVINKQFNEKEEEIIDQEVIMDSHMTIEKKDFIEHLKNVEEYKEKVKNLNISKE